MKDYTSRSNDIYTFVSWDGTTLVPPFSCAYNNGMQTFKYKDCSRIENKQRSKSLEGKTKKINTAVVNFVR